MGLKAAVARIREIAETVEGIRKVHKSEPGGFNHPPETYIADIRSDIGLMTATLGNSSWADTHQVIVRTILGRPADGGDAAEELAFDLLDRFAAAYRPDHTLAGNATNCEVSDYVIAYLEVGGIVYRRLDVILRFRLDRYA
jgi:hypothetical protein